MTAREQFLHLQDVLLGADHDCEGQYCPVCLERQELEQETNQRTLEVLHDLDEIDKEVNLHLHD